MGLIKWVENLIPKMKWHDISFLKLSTFFFTLFLIAIWDGFRNLVLSFEWYWHLLLAVICAIPLMKKMFSK